MEPYSVSSPEESIDISSERTLGLVGSILGLMGAIPYVGSIIALLGLVLVLIALHGIGSKMGDERPFKNYLKGFIVVLAAAIIAVILIIAVVMVNGTESHTSSEFTFEPGSTVDIIEGNDEGPSASAIAAIVLGGIAVIAGIILGAYYQKKAWEAMYEITGVKEFKETAKFLWWGVLTIIILVGVILLLVSDIYQIIAFSNLPKRIAKKSPQPDVPVDDFVW
ncbi:hypothetical protein A3L09_08810 [Thermococcus profundus]|uniref:DUF996 domain-containing protein n=1 Tax=Thermococcus profundus TaxID=49899 RepID=A0A2Z2MN61_THEPR|nr:DUF996 domain-containing protein [Thermococcus profundus]ASJ03348.1 hypothetical protein A3L09_08810 [Thermococcus profundus]